MKMFLLGVLVTWVALNVMVWIMDFADNEFRFADLIRRGFPFCYVFCFLVLRLKESMLIIPFLPLCVKYKINPFYTLLSEVCAKLNTEQARKEWLKVVKKEKEKDKWEEFFRQFPI